MLSNNCSILLIDDDADVLDAYTQLLEQAGYHVSACNNPFDAREQVPKDWPGIVLARLLRYRFNDSVSSG